MTCSHAHWRRFDEPRGLRYEVLCAEQRLLGGALSGYLFGVLGREAWVTPCAVGSGDGDGTPRREARRLGAVVCDEQHFHGPGSRQRPAGAGPSPVGRSLLGRRPKRWERLGLN